MHKQPTGNRNLRRILMAAAALALTTGISLAEPPPGDRTELAPHHARGGGPGPGAGPREDREISHKVENLTGTVKGFNLAPHGSPDAVMIESGGKVIQVNCPPDVGVALVQAAPVGDAVKVTAIGEPSMPEHPVYRLVMLTTSKGQSIAAGGHQAAETVHVEGTVKQLNYTHTGEVDGAVLDTGDFILVGPRSAEELKLATGQKLTVEGAAHPMVLGHNVIHAQIVNGFAIVLPEPHEGGPGMPGAREGGPGGPGGPREGRPPGPGGAREGGPGGFGGPRDGGPGGGPDGPREGRPPGPRGAREGGPGIPGGPREGGPGGPGGPRDGRPPGPGGARDGGPGGPDGPREGRPPGPAGRREGGPGLPGGPRDGAPPPPGAPGEGRNPADAPPPGA